MGEPDFSSGYFYFLEFCPPYGFFCKNKNRKSTYILSRRPFGLNRIVVSSRVLVLLPVVILFIGLLGILLLIVAVLFLAPFRVLLIVLLLVKLLIILLALFRILLLKWWGNLLFLLFRCLRRLLFRHIFLLWLVVVVPTAPLHLLVHNLAFFWLTQGQRGLVLGGCCRKLFLGRFSFDLLAILIIVSVVHFYIKYFNL
jgi:hypothetical protein